MLVEAFACGLPVISTDAPYGPREILADGKYGTLVPVHDALALKNAMVAQMEKGKVAADEESWRRYTLEAAVDRYVKGIALCDKLSDKLY